MNCLVETETRWEKTEREDDGVHGDGCRRDGANENGLV